MAAIALDEEWGFIDTEGRFFVEPQFEEVRSFAEGFATVRADEEWLLLDRSGKRRRVPGLEDPVSVSEGLLPVAVDGRIGFADPNGKLVIAPRFDMAQGFSEGIAAAADQGRWGYINRSGEWIILPRFETACAFMDGRAAVVLPSPHEKDEFSNHEGVVDARGRLKLVVDYPDQERDEAVNSVEWMPFDRGMLSRLAYIDQSGRIVWEGSK